MSNPGVREHETFEKVLIDAVLVGLPIAADEAAIPHPKHAFAEAGQGLVIEFDPVVLVVSEQHFA